MTENSWTQQKKDRANRGVGLAFIAVGVALVIAFWNNGAWASGFVFIVIGFTMFATNGFRGRPRASSDAEDPREPGDAR